MAGFVSAISSELRAGGSISNQYKQTRWDTGRGLVLVRTIVASSQILSPSTRSDTALLLNLLPQHFLWNLIQHITDFWRK